MSGIRSPVSLDGSWRGGAPPVAVRSRARAPRSRPHVNCWIRHPRLRKPLAAQVARVATPACRAAARVVAGEREVIGDVEARTQTYDRGLGEPDQRGVDAQPPALHAGL